MSVLSVLKSCVAWVKHHHAVKVAIRQLSSLSDEELKDIGVLRSEIDDIAHGRLSVH